jgi:hypothetical protein
MIQLNEILDDETLRKVYGHNILLLGMNTNSEMQIWLYIILICGQLEYNATACLLLHKGKDPKAADFCKSEERTTLGQAARKLEKLKLFSPEIIEDMKAIAQLRNSVAHKNILRGITLSAMYKGRNVLQDKDAFEQLTRDVSAVVETLYDWRERHNPYAETPKITVSVLKNP